MEQYKIWDYYQNEGLADAGFPEFRQRYMVGFLRPGQTVLNIGVGGGAFERLAQSRGVKVFSVDPNERAIARLRRTLDMGDRARTGYAQAIPFGNGHFDGVVMCEVLEHLDDGVLHQALCEANRVLKPDGFLLLSTPYREELGRSRVVCPDCGARFHKRGHVQSFGIPDMKRLLVGNGFRIEKLYVSTFVDWRWSSPKALLKGVVRLCLARLGEPVADPHIIALATKPEGIEGNG